MSTLESSSAAEVKVGDLLVRPRKREDELAIAFTLRLAELNGLTKPRWFASGNTSHAHGFTRVCSLCLAEANAYWNQSWCDAQRPWCDVHGVWLADTCGSCGKRIAWKRARLLACQCGKKWSDLPIRTMDPELLRSLRSGNPPIEVLLWLGAIEEFGISARPLKRASGSSLALVSQLLEQGAQVVKDWPTAFLVKLEQWRSKAEEPVELQLFRSAFPGLLRRVARLKNAVWREHILASIDQYVVNSRITSMPIIGRDAFLTHTTSQKAIANTLRIRTERLQSILDQSQAVAFVRSTVSGRSRRYINSAAVEQAAAFLANQMSIKRSASYIGLSTARIQQLLLSKALLRQDGWISRKDLDTFRTSLIAKTVRSDVSMLKPVSLGFALRNWVPVTNTSDFFRAVAEGSISSKQVSTSDVSCWTVDESSIHAWRASLARRTSECFSIPDAAIWLGYKQQVVYDLVTHKLLRTTICFLRKRRARCISQVELDRFVKTYVPLSRLARLHNILNKQSYTWAASQGMKIVTGPLVDGGRQYFVRAGSISRALLSSRADDSF